jgi:membrane protein DedA with SNARE-associated domain
LHDERRVDGLAHTLVAWLGRHTYVVVFLSGLIDAAAIPFPGRIILAAAGAYAAASEVSVLALIALGAAGIVVTDHLWYFAGALSGDRLLRLYCRLTFRSTDCVTRAGDWLRRFGPLVIVVGRFVAVVRVLAWPPAREHGLGYATFLLLELPAALAWTALWVGLGWLLGAQWRAASAEVQWASVGLLVAAAAAVLATRFWRRRRASRATA